MSDFIISIVTIFVPLAFAGYACLELLKGE